MQVSDYPALYQAADAASLRGQREYVWFARLGVGLVVSAAAVGIAASSTTGLATRWLSALVGFLVGAAALMRWVGRSREPNKRWFDGRAVAESVKTITWRYMMRAAPFQCTEEEAVVVLVDELHAVLLQCGQLATTLAPIPEGASRTITAEISRIRALSLEERRSHYATERIRDQAGWYARRSEDHSRAASRWFVAGLSAELLALLFAVLRAASGEGPNVVGLLAAIAAAATALNQLQSHDELTRSYGLASQELLILEPRLVTVRDERELDEVVRLTESTISREHTLWVAKRTGRY
jgi:hypothetical protein